MENEFMFKDNKEYLQLLGGVLSYLQRDIDKLLESKWLDATFMNFGTDKDGVTWILFKVYYTVYKDKDDVLGKDKDVLLVYPITYQLFTRHPQRMTQVDAAAKILSRKSNLSNIDLVKLRILYHIFKAIQSIQNYSYEEPTKVIVANYSDSGELKYSFRTYLPGGFN